MKSTSKIDRQGIAATEFALILPILLILTFGTIEICSAYFIKQTCLIAAHEGARTAITQTATTLDVQNQVNETLTQRGIASNGRVISVVNPETIGELKPITVTVQVPMNGNGIIPNPLVSWFTDRQIQSQCTMYKEFSGPLAP